MTVFNVIDPGGCVTRMAFVGNGERFPGHISRDDQSSARSHQSHGFQRVVGRETDVEEVDSPRKIFRSALCVAEGRLDERVQANGRSLIVPRLLKTSHVRVSSGCSYLWLKCEEARPWPSTIPLTTQKELQSRFHRAKVPSLEVEPPTVPCP